MPTVLTDFITRGKSGSYVDGTDHSNYIVTTTDATATALLSIPLAELEGVVIHGHISGFRSNLTAGLFRSVTCAFRRAAAGNVTSVGAAFGTDVEDSAAAPTVTVFADTANQRAIIRVTGVVAETWRWEGHLLFTKIK